MKSKKPRPLSASSATGPSPATGATATSPCCTAPTRSRRALEEQFINYRIPYKIVGGVRFYERREIKDILAYLRVLLNPYDGLSHAPHHQCPRARHRHDHGGEDQQLRRRATKSPFGMPAAGSTRSNCPRGPKNSVQAFVKIIEYLTAKRDTQPVSALIQNVLDTTGYLDDLKKEKTAGSRVAGGKRRRTAFRRQRV